MTPASDFVTTGFVRQTCLPIVGTYRTLCLAPPPEVRALFEAVRGLQWGAWIGDSTPGAHGARPGNNTFVTNMGT